ncbi:MAG: prenyltransferase/squalene oxidase repeat-containing protein [Nitrososphaeria archaeon]
MVSPYLQRLYQRILDFVRERYSGEGGFMMSPVDYPNPAATYYSLSIMENIGINFEEKEKCIKWLSSFNIDSIYSLYYVVKSLALLNQQAILKKRLLENFNLIKENMFLSPAQKIYEIEQEFKKLYFLSELSNLIGYGLGDDLIKRILDHVNDDGGFGLIGHSTLTSTYYVVSTLNVFDRLSLIDRRKVVGYVRECERPEGGFVTRPENILPYIEYTYYGVKALEIFGEKVNFPLEHIKFVLNCINKDGGFRRTIILGISNLENVYYAVSLLKTLNVDKFISW